MQELLIGAALVLGLVVLDVLALRFGVDTRPRVESPPEAWW
jgi:hypothetical protein